MFLGKQPRHKTIVLVCVCSKDFDSSRAVAVSKAFLCCVKLNEAESHILLLLKHTSQLRKGSKNEKFTQTSCISCSVQLGSGKIDLSHVSKKNVIVLTMVEIGGGREKEAQ